MIVRNQPGAGGLLATNQTWTAEPDGLLIQLMATSGILAAEMGGAPGVGFESQDFSWIGRVSGEPNVVALAPDSLIDDVDDLLALSDERELRIGSTGVGNVHYIEGQILTSVFDLQSNLVVGFSGTSEVYASLARGELDMTTSSASAARAAAAAGSAQVKWLFADLPDRDYPELPPIGAFADEDSAALFRAHADLVAGGRALAGPPGVPEDRLQCLRDAFNQIIESDELLEEAAGINRPVAPISGAELGETIDNLVSEAPEAYLELLRQSFRN